MRLIDQFTFLRNDDFGQHATFSVLIRYLNPMKCTVEHFQNVESGAYVARYLNNNNVGRFTEV
jgi:accessory gene regulator protein AgrB